ncbi:MAG: iron-sulfur cluster assembly accessory protein [Candidatus Micrarchaeota archaeon]
MIDQNMPIGEVVAKHPQAVDIMLKHGLHCVGCRVSPYETIVGGALGHGLTEEDVEKMVAEINEKIKKSQETGTAKNAKSGPGDPSTSAEIISLTKSASKIIKKLMKQEGKKDAMLRISLAAGGCAGYSYEMEFVEGKTEGDLEVKTEGLNVLVEKANLDHLRGTTIDYKESLRETGFVMKNPNVKSACGCGHSVGV